MNPSFSSSSYARFTVKKLIFKSDARARTEGNDSPSFKVSKKMLSLMESLICMKIGVSLLFVIMIFKGISPFCYIDIITVITDCQ